MEMKSDITESNSMKFDLNLLSVFDILLKEQNVTRAAEKLGVSQSAVSASLKKLRIVYEDPLFLRTQRGMEPTTRAIMLKPVIEEALSIVRQSLSGNDDQNELMPVVEIVNLGLSDDLEMAFGARLIQEQKKQFSNIRLVLRQTNSTVVQGALQNGTIDLALTAGGTSDKRLQKVALGQSSYRCVFDGQDQKLSKKISLEEYISRPHILVSYSGLTGIVDDVLAELNLSRNILASTSHFATLPFLISGTDSIATLPSYAAKAVETTCGLLGSVCPISFPSYSIEVSWRYDTVRRKAVADIRDLIVDVFEAYFSDIPR